jgi:hypothetical protein
VFTPNKHGLVKVGGGGTIEKEYAERRPSPSFIRAFRVFWGGECNGFYLATPQVILFISPCSKEARSAIPVGEEKAVANSILAVGEPLSYPCNERVYALA